MENLVGKASNNLAQKCNSHSSCSDNSLRLHENTTTDSELHKNETSSSRSSEVDYGTEFLHEDVRASTPNNSTNHAVGEAEKLGNHTKHQCFGSEIITSPNINTKEENESLTINITSNHQNAIKKTVTSFNYLNGNSQHSDNKQLEIIESNSNSDCKHEVSKTTSTSLLNLSIYESDSDEAETEIEKPSAETDNNSTNQLDEATRISKNSSSNKEASESLCNYVIFSGSSSADSSDSETSNEKLSGETDVIEKSACYRKNEDPSSNSDTSSSESSDNEDEIVETTSSNVKMKQNNFETPRVKGELTLEDLPPVPDLSTLEIDVKEEDCVQMGTIASIVDKLVMVQSLPNMPAYDVDTLLFLENGKRPLGYVYDVIGQVACPMYAIRFNSRQEIDAKGITKDLPVFSAPKTDHTQYVFLKELLKIKGSDASWQGDNEVPPEFVDYSDDEEEFNATNCTNEEYEIYQNKRKRNSLERHQMFEMEMNQRNKLDSAYHKLRDSYEPKYKKTSHSNTHTTRTFNPFSSNPTYTQPNTAFVRPSPPATFGILPQPQWSFVPTVPPPAAGFGMPPFFQNHLCQPFPGFTSQMLAFPPLNVPPPCTAPQPVPPTLPPVNIPPPIVQTMPPPQGIRPTVVRQAVKTLPPPTVQLSVNRPVQSGNLCYPPQNLLVNNMPQGNIKNGQNIQANVSQSLQNVQNTRSANTPQSTNLNKNTSNAQIKLHSPTGPGMSHSHISVRPQQQSTLTQTKVLPHTQSIPQPKSTPPIPQCPPIQSLPPSIPPQFVPQTLTPIPTYGMQPVFQPFSNCMRPSPPLPQNNASFRPNGNNSSVPKNQASNSMPYPPCLGLPKFTTPPPNATSNNTGHLPQSMPHFSGAMSFNQPPPCSQNGRPRYNLSSQNGCGYFRKQF